MPLIEYGQFASHSGLMLPWKIDCDALTDEDLDGLAQIVARKLAFSKAVGVPTGGIRFAQALRRYATPGYPILVADDVLTTGRSMEEVRNSLMLDPRPILGVVIFARGPVPNWVWPIFTVSEWAQSRGTGIG
jgi:orotate phosphoribosyltransferase